MIPKTIHYCWLGDPSSQSQVVKQSIRSWKHILKDYEIVEWNDNTIDFSRYPKIVKEMYDLGKYGFVPDVLRLDILRRYGGIYLDTDMLVLRDFDDLLDGTPFIGAEKSCRVSLGIIGAEKGSRIIDELYDMTVRSIKRPDKPPVSTFVATKYLRETYGLPRIDKIINLENKLTIYPREYFYPVPYDYSQKTKLTDNTYSVHLWNASWIPSTDPSVKKKDKIVSEAIDLYGLFDF